MLGISCGAFVFGYASWALSVIVRCHTSKDDATMLQSAPLYVVIPPKTHMCCRQNTHVRCDSSKEDTKHARALSVIPPLSISLCPLDMHLDAHTP